MSDLSRRDLVKAIGLVPLAGALGACTSPATDSSARAAAGAGPNGTGAPAATFFTPRERETVRVLVDYVIPRDERSGSATDAKVPEFMDVFLAHPETSPDTGADVRGGLAWLDAECERRTGKRFVAAADAERRALLDDIAWPAKARPEMSHGVAFFNRFRDLTASGFFSSAVGFKDLQYEGNAARPEWPGCPPAALARLGVTEDVMKRRVATE